MIKDVWWAFEYVVGDEVSLVHLKRFYESEKAELKNFLASSEEKLADAKSHFQDFKYNKSTLDDLATEDEEAETNLKCS